VHKYIELYHGYIGQVGHEDAWGYFTTEEIPFPHVPEDGRVTKYFYRKEVRREWTEEESILDAPPIIKYDLGAKRKEWEENG